MRLLNLLLVAILIAYAALGTTARYEADDYCQASEAAALGVLGFTQVQYQNWQGRFSSTPLMGALHITFGSRAPSVLPAVLIGGMVGSWYYLLLRIRRTHALTLALVLTLGFIAGVPNTWQTVYWMAAGITYLPPLIGALLLAGWLMRRARFAPGSSSQASMNSGALFNS